MKCRQGTMKGKVPSSDSKLDKLLSHYSTAGKPIRVNFRQLVPWLKYGERASHMIHSYPAKLLPHIPNFFLQNTILSDRNSLVLDPFCGSGTVPLESILAGRKAVGFDTNPLAHLIAKVKTTPILSRSIQQSLLKITSDYRSARPDIPEIINIEQWYSAPKIEGLGKLRTCISRIRDPEMRAFMQICLSTTARKLSYADPRVAVPVRLNPDKRNHAPKHNQRVLDRLNWIDNTSPKTVFTDIVHRNTWRMSELAHHLDEVSSAKIFLSDARLLKKETSAGPRRMSKESVQLAITSPPYVGAQKYIRASSLSLGWLGFLGSPSLRPLERESIGREHYSKSEYEDLISTGIEKADSHLRRIYQKYPLRAHIAANYLCEMRESLSSIYRALKPGGFLVFVIGNNMICGEPFRTADYLKQVLRELGLRLILELTDEIKSRGLMTKRNRTAGVIPSESVFVFEK